MLQTQKFLLNLVSTGKTVEEALTQLTVETGIKVRDYEEFVLLDYDQINSPKMHPMVVECRSLMLAKEDFSILSMKFPRFFNAGECPEYYEDFDVSRSIVMEKADGSLIGVWYNGFSNKWEISTRGMAFAEGNHHMGGTFRSKVLEAMNFTEDEFQNYFGVYGNRFVTYIMEFCSPENRIVTRYTKSHMVLLGVAHHFTPQWVNSDLTQLYNLKQFFKHSGKGLDLRLPEGYPSASLPELMKSVNELTDLKEGFVLFDPVSGKRMKIKAADYILAHRIRGEDSVPTRKNMLELVLVGECAEFLVYFPEYTEMVTTLETEIEIFLDRLDVVWEDYRDIESQKDFALAIKNVKGNGFLFSARKNKTNPRDEFHATNLTSKQKLFLE
jgi:hypothetical protein